MQQRRRHNQYKLLHFRKTRETVRHRWSPAPRAGHRQSLYSALSFGVGMSTIDDDMGEVISATFSLFTDSVIRYSGLVVTSGV